MNEDPHKLACAGFLSLDDPQLMQFQLIYDFRMYRYNDFFEYSNYFYYSPKRVENEIFKFSANSFSGRIVRKKVMTSITPLGIRRKRRTAPKNGITNIMNFEK